jgi:hypothetical protein
MGSSSRRVTLATLVKNHPDGILNLLTLFAKRRHSFKEQIWMLKEE